jgi:hypothetical protein
MLNHPGEDREIKHLIQVRSTGFDEIKRYVKNGREIFSTFQNIFVPFLIIPVKYEFTVLKADMLQHFQKMNEYLGTGTVEIFKVHFDKGKIGRVFNIFSYPFFHRSEEIGNILMY